MLVPVHDRRTETPVYATAGRPRVSHCSGRPSIWHPLGANILGGAPIRLTTSDEDAPSVSLVTTRSRQADTGTDSTAVFVGGGRGAGRKQ